MPPTRRAVRRLNWLFWPVVALITVAVITPASYSAFSSKVSNSGNSFGVGTVALADDDSGSALFSLTNLKPGSTGSKCIAVTSTGSLPSSVKLYTANTSTTNSLASYITMTVAIGNGGTYSSCTGFTSTATIHNSTLASLFNATSYSNGLGTWAPTGNATETRTYQFTYLVQAATPDSAQGGTATFTLTWEAQNT